MAKKQERTKQQIVGFIGVGFDNQDGHQRVTRSEHFYLIGGSAETHEKMQDTAIRFDEGLKRRGRRLEESPVDLVIEVLRESQE